MQVITRDNQTGGRQEFVVLDLVTLDEDMFVLAIEAKKST